MKMKRRSLFYKLTDGMNAETLVCYEDPHCIKHNRTIKYLRAMKQKLVLKIGKYLPPLWLGLRHYL